MSALVISKKLRVGLKHGALLAAHFKSCKQRRFQWPILVGAKLYQECPSSLHEALEKRTYSTFEWGCCCRQVLVLVSSLSQILRLACKLPKLSRNMYWFESQGLCFGTLSTCCHFKQLECKCWFLVLQHCIVKYKIARKLSSHQIHCYEELSTSARKKRGPENEEKKILRQCAVLPTILAWYSDCPAKFISHHELGRRKSL